MTLVSPNYLPNFIFFIVGECVAHNSNAASSNLVAIEDITSYLDTLNELRDMSYKLEHEHRTHQRMLARETKYGSK